MASEKSIIRKVKNRENPYVMIAKSVFEDERLSWKAKGLMGYLLSRPDDWQIIIGDLIKRSKDGRDSVLAGLRELIKFGYLTRVQNSDERGRFTGVIYEVNEDPQSMEPATEPKTPQTDFPVTVDAPQTCLPQTDFPDTDNPLLLINDLTNTEINKDGGWMDVADGNETDAAVLDTLHKFSPQYTPDLFAMLKEHFADADPNTVRIAIIEFQKKRKQISAIQTIDNVTGLFHKCMTKAIAHNAAQRYVAAAKHV